VVDEKGRAREEVCVGHDEPDEPDDNSWEGGCWCRCLFLAGILWGKAWSCSRAVLVGPAGWEIGLVSIEWVRSGLMLGRTGRCRCAEWTMEHGRVAFPLASLGPTRCHRLWETHRGYEKPVVGYGEGSAPDEVLVCDEVPDDDDDDIHDADSD
jgi:hypothetical protein